MPPINLARAAADMRATDAKFRLGAALSSADALLVLFDLRTRASRMGGEEVRQREIYFWQELFIYLFFYLWIFPENSPPPPPEAAAPLAE
jgi:hypothetical protein